MKLELPLEKLLDHSAVPYYFDTHELNYYSCNPKSENPITVVIWYPSTDTPAGDISNGFENLGFSVIGVKQTIVFCSSPEGGNNQINFLLFLITLLRNSKSQEIFKLTSLSHIVNRVKVYRSHICPETVP